VFILASTCGGSRKNTGTFDPTDFLSLVLSSPIAKDEKTEKSEKSGGDDEGAKLRARWGTTVRIAESDSDNSSTTTKSVSQRSSIRDSGVTNV